MALDDITKNLTEQNMAQYETPPVPNLEGFDTLWKNYTTRLGLEPVEGAEAWPGIHPLGFDVPRSTFRRLGPTPESESLMETLAQDQSAFQRWVEFFPRVATKVASEVAQIPGYFSGALDWASTGFNPDEIGKMIDNNWLQAVQEVEQAAKDTAFPVFVPEAVREGGLMRNLSSASFWATEGADAIGFLLSMLVPGRVAKALKAGEGIANIPRLLSRTFKVSDSLIGKADDIVATSLNTVYEAGAEAGETYRNVLEKTGDKNQAGNAAAHTFRSNMLILLGPNYLQQKWLFGGFTKGRALGNVASKKAIKAAQAMGVNPETGLAMETLAAKTPWTKLSHGAQVGLKGILTEGVWEEGSQFATQKYAEEKAEKGLDTNIIDDIIGTADAYISNITETDMQKNVFLGAFMGFFMGGAGGIRETQQAQRALYGTEGKKRSALAKFIGFQDVVKTPGLHDLVKLNDVQKYSVLSDLVEMKDGKPVIENGMPKLDEQKVKEATAGYLKDLVIKEKMAEALEQGNEETFEYLKSKLDFNSMLLYFQQPGGIDVLKFRINKTWAEQDKKFFQDKFGLDLNVDDIKADLLDKADKFQESYTRIRDTHEPNMRVKYDKADQDLYNKFSEDVLDNKITEANKQYHHLKRIDVLRNRLASYTKGDRTVSITSTETKPGDKMVKELTESLAKEAVASSLGTTDINVLTSAIGNIGIHSNMLKESLAREKALYNNKNLQKQYNSELSDSKSTKEAVKEAEQIIVKNANAIQLDPALQGLYNQVAKHDTIDVNGEKIPVKYSGELTINYTDAEGKPDSAVFTVETGYTPTGSMVLKDRQGNQANLRADDVLVYKNAMLKVTEVKVSKTVEDVIADIGKTPPPVDSKTKKKTTPEPLFKDANGVNEKRIKDFESQYKHVFDGTMESWLITEGSQYILMNYEGNTNLKAKYTPDDIRDMVRWKIFTNKYAFWNFKSGPLKGKPQFIFRNYSYDLVSTLEESNPVRKGLKFWTGSIYNYKTYDQIQALTDGRDGAITSAKDDIKVVAFQRKVSKDNKITANLLTADDTGTLDNAKDGIFFTSLPSATEKTANAEQFGDHTRFSLDKIEDTYGGNKSDATAYAKALFDKSLEEYKQYREVLKKEQHSFVKSSVTPGVKEFAEADKIEPETATNMEAKNLSFQMKGFADIPIGEDVFGYVSGTKFPIRNGFLYLMYRNRLENVTPRTIGETGDVDNIYNLFRYLAQTEDNFTVVENYINKILYPNTESPEFSLAIGRVISKEPQKNNLDSIYFGENGRITKTQLVNNENPEEFKKFLATKYWNFDKKSLNSQEFTELKVIEKAGKLSLDSKQWTLNDGAYKGFLFSGKNNNKVKGTVFVKPRPESDVLETKDPQYKNQAIKLRMIKTGDLSFSLEPSKLSFDFNRITGKVETTSKESTNEELFNAGKMTLKELLNIDEWEQKHPEATILSNVPVFNLDEELNSPVSDVSTVVPDFTTNEALPDFTSASELPGMSKDELLTIPESTPTEQPIFEPTVTPDTYWDSLSKADKEHYLEQAKDNVDVAKKIAWATYVRLRGRNIGDIGRAARFGETYNRINTIKAKAWLKIRFPDFPIEVIDQLIDGKLWGQFKGGMKILISTFAEEGTEYHEAFHVVNLLFNTEEDRQSLYNETRSRLGLKDATDKEIEEILAEEFRNYMMSPSDYTFAKNQKLQKTWFQKLLDVIKHFFERYFGVTFNNPSEVESLFKRIDTGKFLLKDKVSSTTEDFNRIGNLSEAESVAYIQEMHLRFLEKMFNEDEEILEESIFDLQNPDVVNHLYNLLKRDYTNDLYELAKRSGYTLDTLPKDFQSKETQILNNWKEAVKRHGEYMLQFHVDLRQDIEEDNDENDDTIREKDSTQYFESIFVSPREITPRAIRLLIASLPSVSETGALTLSSYDTESAVNHDRIMNYLKNNLAQVASLPEMIYKLQSLALQKPELNILLRRLGVPKDFGENTTLDDWKSSMTATKFNLLMQFNKAFSNNKTNPEIQIMYAGGRKPFINAAEDRDINDVRNDWLNGAKGNVGKPNSFIAKNKKGDLIVQKDRLVKAIQQVQATINESQKLRGQLDILGGLGITIAKREAQIKNFTPISNYIEQLLPRLVGLKGEVTINDLYDRDVVMVQSATRDLLKYAASLRANDSELMSLNHKNLPEYQVTLNSFLSNTITRLNSIDLDVKDEKGNTFIPQSVRYLMPYDGYQGNLFAAHSKYINDVILQGGKLEQVLLRGAKGGGMVGEDASRLRPGEYKSLLFNSILQGKIPLVRAETRKVENAIRVLDKNLKPVKPSYTVTTERYVADNRNYLKDEILTSLALKINPTRFGGELANYKTNAQSLRHYDYLYDKKFNSDVEGTPLPSLDEFKQRNVTEGTEDSYTTLKQFSDLADRFVEENKDFINNSIKKYLNTTIDLNLASLEESRVVIKANDAYYVPGIDTDIIKESGIKELPNRQISEADLKFLIKVMTYNLFIGTQEQLKLIGDLAMFSTPEMVNKRFSGAASTRYNSDNSTLANELANYFYPRFDNTTHEYTSKKVLHNDVKPEPKPELVKVSPKYGDPIIGTDSQAWATLEEARSLKIKNGEWWYQHERTYQYETQLLALEVLRDEELQKIFPVSKSQFTDEDGLFYQHTNGKVPVTPMFRGDVIDLTQKLTPISPMKPQGFGNIANVTGVNATQFYKMSVADMMPSVAIELAHRGNKDSLKAILQMMREGDGILSFPSAEKTAYIEPEGGLDELFKTEINEQSTVQEISFDHFGMQLDIHDETDGRTRVSQQGERLEFLDIYDKGSVVEGKEPIAVDESNEIKRTINHRDIDDNIDNFGLSVDENGIYSLKNPKKFQKEVNKLFVKRLLPTNVIDGIALVMDSPLKLFDSLVDKNKIYETLLAYVRNNNIRRKTGGDFLVLESNAIYGDLKFYSRGKDKTRPMEVIVPLPDELLPLVNKVGGLENFNNLIQVFREENPNATEVKKVKEQLGDIDKILNRFGVRIPNHGLNTMEATHIAWFFPQHKSQTIVVPPEITLKSSCDFDVDKLDTYSMNFNMYQGKIHYYEYLTDENSTAEERIKVFAEYALASEFGNEYIDADKNFKTNWLLEKTSELRGKNFKDWTIAEQNIILALENRLNEIAQENLLQSGRFEELVTPLSSDYLYSLANEAKNRREQTVLDDAEKSFGWSKVTQFWYNTKVAEEYWEGKHMIGMSMIENTAHATQQIAPVKVGDSRIKIFFEGQYEPDERSTPKALYTSGHMYDDEGVLVSSTKSELSSAYTEVGKKPIIFELNADVANHNAYSFLNRFGRNSGVGMGTLVPFFTSEVAKAYGKAVKNNGNIFNYRNQYFGVDLFRYRDDLVNEMLAMYGAKDIKNAPHKYKDTLAYAYEKYFEPGITELEKDKWGTIINTRLELYDYEPLNKKILTGKLSNKQKIQILDNLLTYIHYAGHLMNLSRVTRVEAGLENSLNSIDAKYALMETVMTDGFFDANDVQAIFNKTYLGGFKDLKDSARRMFAWASVVRNSPTVYSYFEENFIKHFTKNIWSEQKRKAVLKLIDDMFINYIVNTTGESIEALRNDYKRTLQGSKDVAKTLVYAQSPRNEDTAIINNELIKELKPVIGEYDKVNKVESEIDYVTLFNRRLDTFSQNSLTSSWMDLANHPNPKVQDFARNGLIKQARYQNGYAESPNSFFKLVPNEIFMSQVEDKFKQFLALPEETQLEVMRSFEEQLYLNSWNTRDLVPRRRRHGGGRGGFESYKTMLVEPLDHDNPKRGEDRMSEREMNSKYIAISYYTVPKSEAFRMTQNKQTPPEFTVLYKRYKDASTGGRIIFREVMKLGDGLKFVEFYPVSQRDIETGVVKSILSKNNRSPEIGMPMSDVMTFAEPTTQEDESTTPQEDNSVASSKETIIPPKTVGKEMFGLETLPRIKEILAELNNPKLTKEQKDALGEELGSLYWAPGEMVTVAEKAAMRRKELGALVKVATMPADTKLNQMMKDYLTSLGVKYENVVNEVLKDKFGKEVPEAVAVANLSKMTVQVIENRLDITHLPEEAAHFYVGLLDKNSNFYKSMYDKIINYPIYTNVKQKYSEIYKGDETLIREEAIGQLIANHIVNIYQGQNPELSDAQNRQVTTWWKILWNYIKGLFGKVHTSPFVASAYNIMNKRLAELEAEAQPTGEFFGVDSNNWSNLFADATVGNIKYRYFRNRSDGESYARSAIEAFGQDNVSVLESSGKFPVKVAIKNPNIITNTVNKEMIAEKNSGELNKEKPGLTMAEKELIDNFDKYYPALSHFNMVEREGFVRCLTLGEIEQVCGL